MHGGSNSLWHREADLIYNAGAELQVRCFWMRCSTFIHGNRTLSSFCSPDLRLAPLLPTLLCFEPIKTLSRGFSGARSPLLHWISCAATGFVLDGLRLLTALDTLFSSWVSALNYYSLIIWVVFIVIRRFSNFWGFQTLFYTLKNHWEFQRAFVCVILIDIFHIRKLKLRK